MTRSVVFRVDASLTIGSGHVMRCVTLAHAISEKLGLAKSDIQFICRNQVGAMFDYIQKAGFTLHCLAKIDDTEREIDSNDELTWLGCDYQKDARESLACISGTVDLLIVDHYGIDARWENLLKDSASKILVIDDMANRPHSCDFLLDQTFQRMRKDYSPYINESVHAFCGSYYALLRPEFAERHTLKKATSGASRTKNVEANTSTEQQLFRIFLFMGGSDKAKLSLTALSVINGLAEAGHHVALDLVLGSQFQAKKELDDYTTHPNLHLQVHQNVSNIAELMTQSDIAIGAAGTASWERCCLGLPCLVYVYSDNQVEISEQLAGVGAIRIWKNADELSYQLINLINQPEQINNMSIQCLKICDGQGANRVVEGIYGN